MSAVLRELAGARDLLPLAARAPDRYPCLLESAASGPAAARWDLLFLHDGASIVADAAQPEPFLERLDAAWAAARVPRGASADLPFAGGWVLMLAYELAGEWERRLQLPAVEPPMPRAIALRCPAAILVDRELGRTVLVAEAGREDLLDVLHADLDAPVPPAAGFALAGPVQEDDPQRFLDGVARVHDYLCAGDVFQVNLSRGWQLPLQRGADPAALYDALRRANPAPFAGMFRHAGLAVLSSSPERLVALRGERIETRPIAGTRPRANAGGDDAARIRDLVGSAKERAEHIMLIDLERNDLGRVCVPGSVVVEELMSVESYAHVHHIVSNVAGRLRNAVTPAQVIRAVFPGGTITGCPKHRCMQIIAELEGQGRGPYTGALGWLGNDGDLDLNILIRSIWQQGDRAWLRAGSGIVADSIAERELDETRAKARGMLRAFGLDA
jgi:anthranilate synthase component 1